MNCAYSSDPVEIQELIDLDADMDYALADAMQDSNYIFAYHLYHFCGYDLDEYGFDLTEIISCACSQGNVDVVFSVFESWCEDMHDKYDQQTMLVSASKERHLNLFKTLHSQNRQEHIKRFICIVANFIVLFGCSISGAKHGFSYLRRNTVWRIQDSIARLVRAILQK